MDGWTLVREYRVWATEDVYAWSEVWKHRNGWYSVQSNDGTPDDLKPFKTRSEDDAFAEAQRLTDAYMDRAREECSCEADGYSDECADPSRNIYGEICGVRSQVVDSIDNCDVDQF